MPRPARYDTDTILDAALAEFDAVGARGLSVAGVARALGAPSGSLYHRFPSRDALIGTLWLRAAEGFQAGYLQRLAADRPAIDCAVDGALHVIRWSRARPVEARLLVVYRWQDLVAPEWPEEIATRARATAAALDEGLRGIAARLLPDDPDALLRVRGFDGRHAECSHAQQAQYDGPIHHCGSNFSSPPCSCGVRGKV